MTEQELQALATLVGGKIWKGQLLMPQQATSSAEVTCRECHLEKAQYNDCVQFLGAPNVTTRSCGPTRLVWRPIELKS